MNSESSFEENIEDKSSTRTNLRVFEDFGQAENEKIIESISQSSAEDFYKFINTDLLHKPARHELPQEVIEAILDKGFLIFDQIENENQKTEFMLDLENSFQLWGDFKRKNAGDESISDKAFKGFIEVYKKHPEAGDEFWQFFGQNGQTVRPDIFIEGVADMLSRPDISRYIKDHVVHDLNYLYTFNGNYYDKAILKNLDFKNPENYYKTGTFLEFIKNLYIVGSEWDFSEDKALELMRLLKEAIGKNEGSYFLNLRAREIFHKLAYADRYLPEGDKLPFRISEELYARNTGEEIYLTEGAKELFELNDEYLKLEKKMKPPQSRIDEAVRKGLYYVDYSPPPVVLLERERLSKAYNQLNWRKLTPEDLTIQRRDKSFEDKKRFGQDILDYHYLMRKPVREKIEEEFGLELSGLSLQEQFYFLQFIKYKEAKEIPPIQEFVNKYGKDGLKTFLALDRDVNFGNEIVEFGQNVDPAMAMQVFKKYGEIVDSVEIAPEYFEREFNFANNDFQRDAILRFSEEIHKKGKEVLSKFFKKTKVDNEEQDIMSELEDIKTEVLVFKNAFKSFKESLPWFDINDIPAININTLDGAELKKYPALAGEMKKIYENNYKNYPEKFRKSLLESFDKAMDNTSDAFTVMKHGGKVVSFFRTEFKEENGKKYLYFGSFNTGPDFQSAKLGEALYENFIMEHGGLINIKADCDPKSPISKKYISSGFVGKRFYELEGVPSLEIEFDANLIDTLSTRKMERGKILELSKQYLDSNIVVESTNEGNDINFSHLNDGYLLTQYFTEKNITYAVFEKDQRRQEQKNAA